MGEGGEIPHAIAAPLQQRSVNLHHLRQSRLNHYCFSLSFLPMSSRGGGPYPFSGFSNSKRIRGMKSDCKNYLSLTRKCMLGVEKKSTTRFLGLCPGLRLLPFFFSASGGGEPQQRIF